MTQVISEDGDRVCLGDITLALRQADLPFHRGEAVLDVLVDGEKCGDARITAQSWDSLISELRRGSDGPLLAALQQIRESAKDAKRAKSQEERGERGSRALQPGVEAFMQLGVRIDAFVCQVLDEYERTSPEKEDRFGISMLDGGSAPRGVAPEEVVAALHLESESVGAQVTALNWQVTEVEDKRVIFVLYYYSEADGTRVRSAIYTDSECDYSGPVG